MVNQVNYQRASRKYCVGVVKNRELKQYFVPLTARVFSNTTNVVKE